VGATPDLAAMDSDLTAITQAGSWKSTRMPLQDGEKIKVDVAERNRSDARQSSKMRAI
jgi:hypothetical protein